MISTPQVELWWQHGSYFTTLIIGLLLSFLSDVLAV